MRPLSRPSLPSNESGFYHEGWIIQEFGDFCMISEDRLSHSYLWDRKTGHPLSVIKNEEEWDHALLLCQECYRYAMKNSQHTDLTSLLYPDQTVASFDLENKTGIFYTLEDIQWTVYKENHDIHLSQLRPMVIAQAADPQAEASIQFFQLNSPYYNAAQKCLNIPHDAYLMRQEQRIEIRTQAWMNAKLQAQRWREEQDSFPRSALKTQIQLMASYQGCWSIWMTVFWQEFQDPALLAELFFPDKTKPPHSYGHAFPGTRPIDFPKNIPKGASR